MRMELLMMKESKAFQGYRRRPRKSPRPQASPFNSIQDLYRFPPNDNVVEIESSNPTNSEKRKVMAELKSSCPHNSENTRELSEVKERNQRAKMAKVEKEKKEVSAPVKSSKKRAIPVVEEGRANVINDERNNVDHLLQLPEKFMTKIRELGYAGDGPTLVIQKELYPSDVNSGLQRLSIPANQVQNQKFLAKFDEKLREQKDGIESILIDDNLREWNIKFKKWNTTAQYVFISPWNEIVKKNGLKAGMQAQVWSFRMNKTFYFILVQLK